MGITAKRSSMMFYSDAHSHYSHRVRIVLAEKAVSVDIIDVIRDKMPEDLTQLNPYNSLPTLVDRELVLYETKVMMEYLDERFPHPPLLPVYPVARADIRQLIYRMEKDWFSLVDNVETASTKKAREAICQDIKDNFVTIAPIFAQHDFFMSDDFSLADCCLAPVLWRLPHIGVQLPKTKQTKPLFDYMKRTFSRESFQESLSDFERDMESV